MMISSTTTTTTNGAAVLLAALVVASTSDVAFCSLSSASSAGVGVGVGVGYNPFNYGQNTPGMKWFSDAKFGLFMHNGPVTQWGTEISFPLVCTKLPCTPQGPGKKPVHITTTEDLAAHRQVRASAVACSCSRAHQLGSDGGDGGGRVVEHNTAVETSRQRNAVHAV